MPRRRLTVIPGGALGQVGDIATQGAAVTVPSEPELDRMFRLARGLAEDLMCRSIPLLSTAERDRLHWRLDEFTTSKIGVASWMGLCRRFMDDLLGPLSSYERLAISPMWDQIRRMIWSIAVDLDAHPHEMSGIMLVDYHEVLNCKDPDELRFNLGIIKAEYYNGLVNVWEPDPRHS